MVIHRFPAFAFVLLIAAATSASAQFSEPGAFQALHPDRDVLNGGELTPAGRMELERTGRGVPADANASMRPGGDEPPAGGALHHRPRHRVRP
jgi:hypothetical protein